MCREGDKAALLGLRVTTSQLSCLKLTNSWSFSPSVCCCLCVCVCVSCSSSCLANGKSSSKWFSSYRLQPPGQNTDHLMALLISGGCSHPSTYSVSASIYRATRFSPMSIQSKTFCCLVFCWQSDLTCCFLVLCIDIVCKWQPPYLQCYVGDFRFIVKKKKKEA